VRWDWYFCDRNKWLLKCLSMKKVSILIERAFENLVRLISNCFWYLISNCVLVGHVVVMPRCRQWFISAIVLKNCLLICLNSQCDAINFGCLNYVFVPGKVDILSFSFFWNFSIDFGNLICPRHIEFCMSPALTKLKKIFWTMKIVSLSGSRNKTDQKWNIGLD